MLIDLDDLARRAETLFFNPSRQTGNILEVILFDDTALVFQNFLEDDDNAFGFKSTPWHAHDRLFFASDGGIDHVFDPKEVLSGLRSGELLIASRYLAGELKDMWIEHVHPLGGIELREADEEFRLRRLG